MQELPAAVRRKLVDAAQDENLQAVQLLLSAGRPTDARAHEGATALHWAAFLGNSEIARGLLRYGASVADVEPSYQGTPLHWALYGSVHGWRCQQGDFVVVVDALLKAGARLPEKVDTASDALRDFLSKRTSSA
ncbi:MAG: ankyrin repeat domain-containing protein [Gemmatimonadaceae bacterium]